MKNSLLYSGKNKKIGILGGTFNPVHSGHINMAQCAYTNLNLDKVVFMPAGIPPHKELDFDTSPKDRLHMLTLAIKKYDNFFIDDYEAYSGQKAYTYLSLQRINETLDNSSEIYFIIGADSLMQLDKWKSPEKLLALSKFAVIPRDGITDKQCTEKIKSLTKEYGGEILYLKCKKVKMSSTRARESNLSEDTEFLNKKVVKYIKRNGLYNKMTQQQKIEEYLEDHLSKKRLLHVYGTVRAAERLAEMYGADAEKAKLAALLHDCAKHMEKDELLFLAEEYGFEIDETYQMQPELLHGAAGAYVAKNLFGINDQEILDAIVYHTVPRLNMSKLDKIIPVADLIEETRAYSGIEDIRKFEKDSLDAIFEKALERVMIHVIEQNHMLHINSVLVYNNLLKQRRKSDKLKQTQGDE